MFNWYCNNLLILEKSIEDQLMNNKGVKMLKKIAGIISAGIVLVSGASTPNSQYFNDFSLEMETGWKAYVEQKADKWHVDSIYFDGVWALDELTVADIKVGDATYTGDFNSKNGVLVSRSRTSIKKDNDNLGYTITAANKDTLTGLWYKATETQLKFNSSGKCLSWSLNSYTLNSSTPQVVTMTVYHNANNLIDSSITSMSMASNGTNVDMKMKSNYQYDAQNRYIERLDSTIISMTDFPAPIVNGIKKNVITYGNQSMIIKVESYDDNTWTNSDSIYVSLNTDEEIVYEEQYSWDDDNSTWSSGEKIAYEYENGKIVSEINYSKENDTWDKIGVIRYYYTDYNGSQLPSLDGEITANKIQKIISKTQNSLRSKLVMVNKPDIMSGSNQKFLLDGRRIVKLNTRINRIQPVIVK